MVSCKWIWWAIISNYLIHLGETYVSQLVESNSHKNSGAYHIGKISRGSVTGGMSIYSKVKEKLLHLTLIRTKKEAQRRLLFFGICRQHIPHVGVLILASYWATQRLQVWVRPKTREQFQQVQNAIKADLPLGVYKLKISWCSKCWDRYTQECVWQGPVGELNHRPIQFGSGLCQALQMIILLLKNSLWLSLSL